MGGFDEHPHAEMAQHMSHNAKVKSVKRLLGRCLHDKVHGMGADPRLAGAVGGH
jgi:hypothetical protein